MMNTPEKIVQAYIRLNGFFSIPQFTVLKGERNHIDFLAVRLGGSVENVGMSHNTVSLKIDEQLLKKLGVTKDDTIGIVVEVKGSKKPGRINTEIFEYAKSFFGTNCVVKKVGFENNNKSIEIKDDHIIVPIKYCIKFIKNRFNKLKKLKKQGIVLSKESSWDLSDEFLSDLIYLYKMKI